MALSLAPLVVWLALAPAPPDRKLEITDVRPVYGYFDQDRPRLEYCAHQDLICFRFALHGVGLDNGRTDLRVEGRLLNDSGESVAFASAAVKMPVVFGGDQVPGLVELPLTAPVSPGKYTFRATVTDNTNTTHTSFERPVTLVPTRLAVRRAKFFLDPGRHVTVQPQRAQVGQALFFAYELILPDPSGDELEVTLRGQVLDAETHTPVGPAFKADVHGPNPHQPATSATFQGPLGPLTRPGRFIVQATFTDLISGDKVTFETPLHVSE